MSTVSLKSKSPFSDLLKKVEQLSTPDLEEFAHQVLLLKAWRKRPNVSPKELELLEKINKSFPADLKSRFDCLTEKRRAGTLDETEYQELLKLSKKIEKFNVKRVTYLSELAQIRGISMRELMDKLGMKPPSDV